MGSTCAMRRAAGRPAVRAKFIDLARELGTLGAWVRLHYVYPYPHIDEVIGLMAEARFLPYLDIPFQHAAPKVLKAMRRPGDQEKTLDRIKAWRSACPDLALRSTFIVGFPGETEEDFDFCLPGWRKRGSTASAPSNTSRSRARRPTISACPVPAEVAESRYAASCSISRRSARNLLKRKVGRHMQAIVDKAGPTRGGGPQQGRRTGNRRQGAYRQPPAAAPRRHRLRQDRARRRLRSLRHGGVAHRTEKCEAVFGQIRCDHKSLLFRLLGALRSSGRDNRRLGRALRRRRLGHSRVGIAFRFDHAVGWRIDWTDMLLFRNRRAGFGGGPGASRENRRGRRECQRGAERRKEPIF